MKVFTNYVLRSLAAIPFLLLFTNTWAQTTYYSKSTATDFNDVTSWGTATNGTGAAPAALSSADFYVISNSANLTLSNDAIVRRLTISAGTLNVSSRTLTVSTTTSFDSYLHCGATGTLNVTGGTIAINGSLTFENGAAFAQSGGLISVEIGRAHV